MPLDLDPDTIRIREAEAQRWTPFQKKLLALAGVIAFVIVWRLLDLWGYMEWFNRFAEQHRDIFSDF